MDDVAIRVEKVSKVFKLPHEKTSSIKSAVVNFWRRDRGYEMQKALNNVSFEVKKGEFFGIVGRNGSGKSTLLKLLAGIYTPTQGTVEVNGSLTPFIELGVGFNDELTGRENVYLNGALLGFNRKEMRAMYDDIVEFAELKEFMDQKLKNYSSGMQVRLAFSIAIRAQSDILLIDEVLAVGDAAFQRKCLDYFGYLKRTNKTVVFISHDMDSVRKYCDRTVFIDRGALQYYGDTNEAISKYSHLILGEQPAYSDSGGATHTKKANADIPIGMNPSVKIDRSKASIDKVWIEAQNGRKNNTIHEKDKYFFVRFDINIRDFVEGIVPGVVISNSMGEFVSAFNTTWAKIKSASYDAGEMAEVSFKIPNIYERGDYFLSVNVVSKDLNTFYHWKNEIQRVYFDRSYATGSLTSPPVEVKLAKK